MSWPCVSTAFAAAGTVPLPCISTAKTLPDDVASWRADVADLLYELWHQRDDATLSTLPECHLFSCATHPQAVAEIKVLRASLADRGRCTAKSLMHSPRPGWSSRFR